MASVFEVAGVRVAVEADDADRRWLAGFGGCEEHAPGPCGLRVAFEAAPGAAPPPGRESRVAFALDSGPLRLPVTLSDGVSRAWDAAAGALLEVSDGGRATRIRYVRGRPEARLLLLRVVREYAHNQALADGALIVHAAAVVEEGRAFAIAGPKAAGKTTLALRRMEAGSRYLSNDRIRIDPDGVAAGIPTVVTVRPGTQALFPERARRLRAGGDYRLEEGQGAPREDEAGLRVSPAQLCAAFDQAPAPPAALGSMLFLDPDGGTPRALDPAAAAVALEGCLVGQAAGVHASELFRSDAWRGVTPAGLRERCLALAARVACLAGRP